MDTYIYIRENVFRVSKSFSPDPQIFFIVFPTDSSQPNFFGGCFVNYNPLFNIRRYFFRKIFALQGHYGEGIHSVTWNGRDVKNNFAPPELKLAKFVVYITSILNRTL